MGCLLLLIGSVLVCSRCSFAATANVPVDGSLILKNVDRKLDLSSSLAKVVSELTFENAGKASVDLFLFSIEADLSKNLAFIGASSKESDEETVLLVQETTVDSSEKGAIFYKVMFAKPLATGKSTSVTVKTSFTHVVQPFPAEIKQAEKQLVRFNGNLYQYSPYEILAQKTVVMLSSANVESYTKTKPVSKSEATITYGPFGKVNSFSRAELSIHYENNNAFLAVTTMTRLIEVSHWGNIAVEETYDLRHTGAKLKGQFSRYDYQRQPNPFSSVKSFKTILPASATDVYYRDEIGNISTSRMKEMDDAVELELTPRFPLFGGWKTHYMIGYNVPSYQYLWTDGGSMYALKIPFIDHIYDNQVVDEIVVKIILPEGSKVEDIMVPFGFERLNDEKQFTYLDTVGRPVIMLSKRNVVSDHIQDFELRYSFNKIMLLREPLLVVGFFYLIFLFVIVYVRMDFAISPDESAESKLKVASYVEQVLNILDGRSALYQAYEDAINKYKASKDQAAYQVQRKKVDADHKSLIQQVSDLQAKFKQEGSDATAEKLSEIQRLDTQYKESIIASAGLAEKLVGGKLAKDQYLPQEEQAAAKRKEMLNKIDSLATQL